MRSEKKKARKYYYRRQIPIIRGTVRIPSETIERFLERHPYRPVRVPDVEEKMEANKMVEVFMGLVERGRLVDQWEFARLCSRAGGPYYRAARAWASFMMEYHFMQLLREAGYSYHYSIEDDFEKGVDITVDCGWRNLRLHIYYDTEKAREWAELKRNVRHEEKDVIEFPLHPEEAKVVGNVHLYTKEHLWLIDQLCRC